MGEDNAQNEYESDIPIDAPASRIVSLVPSLTESLFDINLGDRIVGITDYCTRPADKLVSLARVGGTKDADVEQILALEPDLVFASKEENSKETVEALQAAGIPVWVTVIKTVPDVFNVLWDIMNTFEETTMVPRIRLIEYTYDWVKGSVKAKGGPPCRVFVPIWDDPLMTFTADTFTHDLLTICGGQNVFADYSSEADSAQGDAVLSKPGTRYPCVTMDDVVAAQPDVILLPSEPYRFTEADVPRFAALDVPAAHNNQIHLVDGSLLTWPGTRVVYALAELPPLLCPVEEINDQQP